MKTLNYSFRNRRKTPNIFLYKPGNLQKIKMKIFFFLLLVIAAIIGSIMNTEQGYRSCRRFNNPRRCRRHGCYWDWYNWECYPWWWRGNNENRGNREIRGRV